MNNNEQRFIDRFFRAVEIDMLLGKLPSRTHYPVGPRDEQRGPEDDALVLRDLQIEEEWTTHG